VVLAYILQLLFVAGNDLWVQVPVGCFYGFADDKPCGGIRDTLFSHKDCCFAATLN
jgi:hypothetical protein